MVSSIFQLHEYFDTTMERKSTEIILFQCFWYDLNRIFGDSAGVRTISDITLIINISRSAYLNN